MCDYTLVTKRAFGLLVALFLLAAIEPVKAAWYRFDERLIVGIGPRYQPVGGVFHVFRVSDDRGGPCTCACVCTYEQSGFYQVPWEDLNNTGRGVHPAVGDVGDFTGTTQNGPGMDEAVIGLSTGGGGWLAIMIPGGTDNAYNLDRWVRVPWPAYNDRNGETFPAVGNLDADPWDEIVVGLGETGGGWFAIFDDAAANYAFLGWRQLQWPAYNQRNGALHPAVGDIDGDGQGEIVLGLEEGGGGWLAVVDGAASGFSHRRWLRVNWSAYNERNGLTYPAIGDIDGDGRDEIVVGLGTTSGGWVQIFDDAAAGFATSWTRSSRPYWRDRDREIHPAVGNMDADGAAEIVFGFEPLTGLPPALEIRDDAHAGYAQIGFIEPYRYNYSDAGTFPAIGRLLDFRPPS